MLMKSLMFRRVGHFSSASSTKKWLMRHCCYFSEENLLNKFNMTPNNYNLFQIGAIVNITHNVKMFRVALPESEAIIPYKSVPSYVIVKASDESNMKDGMRYHPIGFVDQKGYFDVLVKDKPHDAVAGELLTMSQGDFIQVKGPYTYNNFKYCRNMRDTIHMIAGGSGISVLLQIIREIFRDEKGEDKTKVRLLYANRSEADAALRVAFDDLHFNMPHRFEVTYLFESETKDSQHTLSPIYIPRLLENEAKSPVSDSIGEQIDDDDEYDYVMLPQTIKSIVSHDVVKAFLDDPFMPVEDAAHICADEDYHKPLVLVCGPPRMMELVCGRTTRRLKRKEQTEKSTLGGILGDLGYSDDSVVSFD